MVTAGIDSTCEELYVVHDRKEYAVASLRLEQGWLWTDAPRAFILWLCTKLWRRFSAKVAQLFV
jgi:hypothetical protein